MSVIAFSIRSSALSVLMVGLSTRCLGPVGDEVAHLDEGFYYLNVRLYCRPTSQNGGEYGSVLLGEYLRKLSSTVVIAGRMR